MNAKLEKTRLFNLLLYLMLKYDILEIEHAFHEIALQKMLAMNHNFSLLFQASTDLKQNNSVQQRYEHDQHC